MQRSSFSSISGSYAESSIMHRNAISKLKSSLPTANRSLRLWQTPQYAAR